MKQDVFKELTNYLDKKKNISKETLLEAIRQSIIQACKSHYGKTDVSNVIVNINQSTNLFEVYAEKKVVEKVEDELTEISLTDAKRIDSRYELDDVVRVEIKSENFGRIATQNAKNVILQKIREEERKSIYEEYLEKERDIVTGKVEWNVGKNLNINIGRTDAILTTEEMIPNERFHANQKIKLYITEVKDTPKGPKILVSRRHPELIKRLFEAQVTEIQDGTVEIKSIAREAGVRTKIAVWSNNPDVDAVGACVGVGGARVNEVVRELGGEKIDIIQWDENPAYFIENSLSPSEVIYVAADADEKTATVVVPDTQLSLAIGKEGLNARLAARLTGFVAIDIKSETVAIETGILPEYPEDGEYDEEYDEEAYDDYEESYDEETYREDSYDEGANGDAYEAEVLPEE
jgi:N utilization substance protein A